MYSVIVVYSNDHMYSDLVSQLKQQDCADNLEIIGVNNVDGKYSSAAKALNYGASCAGGEVLIFLHQDIDFILQENEDGKYVISKFAKFICNYDDAIVGVAGYAIGGKKKFSKIVHGKDFSAVGEWGENEFEFVETVDECFFGMKKSVWERFKFNELICDDWHLYAVEFALRARLQEIKCVSVPVRIWHKSTGNMNFKFYEGVKKIIKEYKKTYKYLYTTCVQIRNSRAGLFIFRLRKRIGKIIYGLRRQK